MTDENEVRAIIYVHKADPDFEAFDRDVDVRPTIVFLRDAMGDLVTKRLSTTTPGTRQRSATIRAGRPNRSSATCSSAVTSTVCRPRVSSSPRVAHSA